MATKRYDAILDAALTAFAKNGFDGIGLREIAKTAGVAAATINYHFETKEKLFQEVVRRGAERSVRRRLERLDDVLSIGKNVELEDIVRALFHIYNIPPEEISLADYEFNQLVVRFGFPDNEFARNVVHAPFDDMAIHFIEAMIKTPDGFTRQAAARAYLWSLPAGMTAISQHVRYARLASIDPEDFRNVHSFDALVDFICVGMRALAKARPSSGRKKKASRPSKA